MPTISVRALGPNNDALKGSGQNNFLYDIDAVAQIIVTRLRLLQGEWWENLNLGFPLFQNVLGVSGATNNVKAIELLIQQCILQTPYVNRITNANLLYTPATRSFAYSANVITQFGTLVLKNAPASAATLNS